MTTDRLFNHVSASHDFLFAKTEVPHPEGMPPASDRPATDLPLAALSDIYPDVVAGGSFLEKAMEALSSVQVFSACAIRSHLPDPEALLQVAKAVDRICREEDGFWGMIHQDLFGCFFPDKSDAFCTRAVLHIRNGLPKTNRFDLIVGTAVYPTLSYAREQILDNACKAVDHAAFFGPNSTIAFDDITLNISGDKLFQNGDIEAAVEEYKKALLLKENNINVRNSLGVCYGLLDRLDLAQHEFEAAVCCGDGEFMALYNLGLVHMLQENREKALGFFQKALTLKDDLFEATFQTGRLLLEMGNPKDSLPYLKKAFRLNPLSASAARLLGDCFVALRDINDAMEAYKKAIKLNPNDASSLSTLGALYDLKDENTDIATLYCEKSVQLAPEEGLFHQRLGRLYQKQNRQEEAQNAFAAAARFGKKHREAIENMERSQRTG